MCVVVKNYVEFNEDADLRDIELSVVSMQNVTAGEALKNVLDIAGIKYESKGGTRFFIYGLRQTDQPAPKPKPAPAPKPVVHETITLGAHALFDHDKSSLRPEGKSELDTLAAKLRAFSSVQSINVVGHTDSDGTEAYNQGLSESRAASVKDYLIQQGVSGSVISTSGQGESSPATSNATKEGRQQNRRVEIGITATK